MIQNVGRAIVKLSLIAFRHDVIKTNVVVKSLIVIPLVLNC